MDILRSEIVFDEQYCHSAGSDEDGNIYEIARGTNEIVFKFGDFDAFIKTYVVTNPYLPAEIKHAFYEKVSYFCAQVIQDGAHVFAGNIGSDGTMTFNRDLELAPTDASRLETFKQGMIGFGILNPSTSSFAVLWATAYRSS